jgi:beta-N-acetylhexosaminidase
MRGDPDSGTASSTTSGWRFPAIAVTALLGLMGCSGAAQAAAGSHLPAAGHQGSSAAAAPAAAAADPAQTVYDRMSQAQRIGQLFMVGVPVTGLSTSARTAITTYHVGNVLLTGRTTAGAAPVRALTSAVDALTTSTATAGVPLLVATDQEGGNVQVLKGTGFSTIPTALTQGGWSDTTLTSRARTWGSQVFRAGLNVDLAPVMDTVPQALANTNPIGHYQREYGYTEPVVADKGAAFLRGMRASGLAMTAKHFPGLGHVTANTDTSSGVTDTVTTRTSADVAAFRAAIGAGAGLVMISSAVYSRIDGAHPAAFSKTVIGGMLRGDLGFTGVVVSDDLGRAKQVQAWSAGARAVGFLAAGGDVVLTVDPTLVPAMVGAVTTRAAGDATFAAGVKASVLRVLRLKAADGLLAPRLASDGALGPLTAKALQRWLGVTQSGVLAASTIRALQTRIGTTSDGVWGPASMAALQTYLGIARDGARTWNARTVTQLQKYLNTQL